MPGDFAAPVARVAPWHLNGMLREDASRGQTDVRNGSIEDDTFIYRRDGEDGVTGLITTEVGHDAIMQ